MPPEEFFAHRDVETGLIRTETLRLMAAYQLVGMDLLTDPNAGVLVDRLWWELRRTLDRMMAENGRLPVGDIAISQHEDFLKNAMVFRAEVRTRESDEGHWAGVWAAYHEDQAALKGRADDWDEDGDR